jgi:uncharacterized protein (TIGR02001 family)
VAVLLACPALAAAQWAFDARLVSDYVYRGFSLSAGRASVQASAGWDGPDGWYGGAQAAPVRLRYDDIRVVLHGGRALRLAQDLSVDLGASATVLLRDSHYNYGEFYVGIGGLRWSARASFSPRYFGSDAQSLYIELNGNLPLGRVGGGTLSLFGHAGSLNWLSSDRSDERAAQSRHDGELGLAWTRPRYALQASWVGAGNPGRLSKGVVSAAYFF